jgi:hypothetical protein
MISLAADVSLTLTAKVVRFAPAPAPPSSSSTSSSSSSDGGEDELKVVVPPRAKVSLVQGALTCPALTPFCSSLPGSSSVEGEESPHSCPARP